MVFSTRERLIQLFTRNPDSEIHMRGIGRILRKEPGVFQRSINALVEEGILESEYKANARFFRLAGKHRTLPAEKRHQRFDDHLKALVNSTTDRICSRDMEGGLLAWNRAFADSIKTLFGVDPYVGLKTWELIPPSQQKKLECVSEAYKKVYAGETVVAEYEYPMPDGEIRRFETSWVPVWEEGEVRAAGEVTRDITSRTHRERKKR